MSALIGHRGVAAEAPENTLEGVREAARRGFRWVEIDTLPTGDGVAVVSHDDSLRRLFGADLEISGAPLGRVRESAAALPTLAELLELSAGLGLGVNVEIKPGPRTDRANVGRIMGTVARHDPARIVVSSFSAEVLGHVRARAPDARLALVMATLRPGWRREAERLGAGNIHLGREGACGDGSCERVKDEGYGLYVFTVNDTGTCRKLRERGADGVFTDTSALMACGD